MHPDLRTVIELQQADLRIADLSSQIDSLPSQIRKVEVQLADFLKAYDERKQRLAQNQKERRDMEGDIQAIRAKISKHRDQLYEMKTNEQYKAMVVEIEGEETKIRAIEDKLLEEMLEAEQLDQFVKEAAARLEGEKARVAAEVRRLESLRDQDVAERSGVEAERQRLAESLPVAARDLYEKTRRARGLAVAQVIDASCSGCHVRLRPQAYNEVRASGALSTCETCGRILYYIEPQPLESEAAAEAQSRVTGAASAN